MNDQIQRLITRIDFQRISGVRSVLGLALEDDGAYVVELQRRGSPFDWLSGKIEALKWLWCELEGDTIESDGRALKISLLDAGIRTPFAVISPRGARYVSAVIPPEVENVREWVEENTAKLLELPVAPSELAFHLEFPGSEASDRRALITFFRKGEIGKCQELAAAAGLKLLSIAAGLEELIPISRLSQSEPLPPTFRIVHHGQSTLSTLTCEGSRLVSVQTEHVSSRPAVAEIMEKTSAEPGAIPTKVFFSGAYEDSSRTDGALSPFGLQSEYALASGLALKGILPKCSQADFLPQSDQEARELDLSKILLKRTVLASGLLLFLGLAIPFGVSSLTQMKTRELEDRMVSAGGGTVEIEAMEKEAAFLKESVLRFESSESRSISAFMLHEVARVTPKNVRLLFFSLQIDEPSLLLKGEAQTQSDVSEFMRSLKKSPLCRELSLKKLETGGASLERVRSGGTRVYFELSVRLNPRGGS